jgi:hypothetical protein
LTGEGAPKGAPTTDRRQHNNTVGGHADDLHDLASVHGCADFYLGRPYECCPYDRRGWPTAWRAWRQGWLLGSLHAQVRGEYERRRWLRGDAV